MTEKWEEALAKSLREEDLELLKRMNNRKRKRSSSKGDDFQFWILCESDPDACLKFIEKLFGKTPELEFPLVKVGKVIAYYSNRCTGKTQAPLSIIISVVNH